MSEAINGGRLGQWLPTLAAALAVAASWGAQSKQISAIEQQIRDLKPILERVLVLEAQFESHRERQGHPISEREVSGLQNRVTANETRYGEIIRRLDRLIDAK